MPDAAPPLDAADETRLRAITERLERAADPTGFVPFDRFMEISLYADGIGYYQRAATPLGTTGDYYTAAHVDPLFAESLARRVVELHHGVSSPTRFTIVELGPGDGTLAAGLLHSLGPSGIVAEYVLVDRSPARARDAAARLAAERTGIPVRSAASLAAVGPTSGVVLVNELLDAQPARRLRWDGAEWRELGVRTSAGRCTEVADGPARPVPGPPLPTDVPVGQVVEVSSYAEGLIREVGDHLVDGAAVILDFGGDEAELVRAHPEGTLAAVRGHRFSADPCERPGASDLSTFVNFGRVRAVARSAGLVELAYRSQAEALGAWGFAELRDRALRSAPDAETRVRRQLAAKNLLFGFERFRVLELAPVGGAGRRTAAT